MKKLALVAAALAAVVCVVAQTGKTPQPTNPPTAATDCARAVPRGQVPDIYEPARPRRCLYAGHRNRQSLEANHDIQRERHQLQIRARSVGLSGPDRQRAGFRRLVRDAPPGTGSPNANAVGRARARQTALPPTVGVIPSAPWEQPTPACGARSRSVSRRAGASRHSPCAAHLVSSPLRRAAGCGPCAWVLGAGPRRASVHRAGISQVEASAPAGLLARKLAALAPPLHARCARAPRAPLTLSQARARAPLAPRRRACVALRAQRG